MRFCHGLLYQGGQNSHELAKLARSYIARKCRERERGRGPELFWRFAWRIASATNSLFILRMFFSFEALPWRLLAEETNPRTTYGHSSIKKPSNSFEFEICIL